MKEVINIFLGNNVNDGDDDDDDDDPCTVMVLHTCRLTLSLCCRLSLYGLNR